MRVDEVKVPKIAPDLTTHTQDWGMLAAALTEFC